MGQRWKHKLKSKNQLWTQMATEACFQNKPTFGKNYLELFRINRLINPVQHFLRPTVATYVLQIQWKKPKDIFDLLKANLNIECCEVCPSWPIEKAY